MNVHERAQSVAVCLGVSDNTESVMLGLGNTLGIHSEICVTKRDLNKQVW